MLFRLGLVENVAEAFTFTVGQPLGDAVGRTVRHEHDEPARERDLLGETGTLVGDRVLGDLGENRLLGLEDVLDTGLLSASLLALASAVEIIGVVLDIAGIEHGVLGRGDVDERGFHAGQDVLDPSEVDVAVDLADVVGRTRDLMLDQFASLEGCDLGGLGADMDTHEITADGLALAGATTPTLQRLFVKFDRAAGGDGLDGCRTATLPLLATPVVLVLTILVWPPPPWPPRPRPRPPAGVDASWAGRHRPGSARHRRRSGDSGCLDRYCRHCPVGRGGNRRSWGPDGCRRSAAWTQWRTSLPGLRLRRSGGWGCRSGPVRRPWCSSFVVDAAAEIMRPPPVRARLRRHSLGRGARRRRW